MWKDNARAYIALLQRTIQKIWIEIHLKGMKDKFTFIDLGLPSGRLWASENAEGYFTYDEAKEKFGELLPKTEAFEELWEKCQWLWDVKKNGMIVVGPNNNTIFLPASGYRDGASDSLHNVGSHGYYWSYASYIQDYARNLYFYSSGVCPLGIHNREGGFSVRLCKEQ